MAYIEVHHEIVNHPKTKRLCRALKIDRPTAIGYVVMLQHWAIDYAPDGDLSACDPADIADGSQWPGDPQTFMDAIRSSGFMDEDGTLHNWDKYGGKYIRSRDQGRKRQADKRERDKLREAEVDALYERLAPVSHIGVTRDSGVTHAVGTGLEERREAQRTEAKQKKEREEPETRPDDALSQDFPSGLERADPVPITAHPPHLNGTKTTLPDDWTLDPLLREQTRKKRGWSDEVIDHVAEKFRNDHQSKGTVREDWTAAWWKWVEDEIVDKRKVSQIQARPKQNTPMTPDWLPRTGSAEYALQVKRWDDARFRAEVEEFRQEHIRLGTTSMDRFVHEWGWWMRDRPYGEPVVERPVVEEPVVEEPVFAESPDFMGQPSGSLLASIHVVSERDSPGRFRVDDDDEPPW